MCDKCNGNCNSCNCTCQEPCLTPDCACKVFITTDCVTLTEDLPCSNIAKGLTETEVLKQLDAYICERFQSVENFLQIVNVGGGAGIYKGISVLGKKELKSLVSDGTITITPGTDTINFSVNFPPEINQDNFVRQLIIDINDLPNPNDYLISDLIDYILALPAGQRTIAETDSKWNIIPSAPAEGGYISLEVYELQNIGKGVITSLEYENFLLLKPIAPSWNDTLRVDSNLYDGINTQVAQSWGVFSNQGTGTSNGFYLKDISLSAPDIPIYILGVGMGQTDIERSLAFYTDRTIFMDGLNNKGLEYPIDYSANFTSNSLVTKLYTDNKIATEIGNIPPVTGSETKVTAGTNVTVTGNGTIATPYVINSATPDGSETIINAGSGIAISGIGTIASPYVISTPTTPQVIALLLNSWTKDRQHSISTGLSGVTILGVHIMLQCLVANSGYAVGDTVTVNTPELNDSGGRPDQGIGVQYNNNNVSVIRVMTNQEITIMGAWTSDGATNTENAIGLESQWAIKVIVTYI